MTTKILFVCLGNICRSPTAEAVFRSMADGRDIAVDSAGTSDWHVGEPAWPKAVEAAARRGYDMEDLRGRQLNRNDFDSFDLIIGMDDENLAEIEALRPMGNETPARLFMDFVPSPDTRFVPDPYYSGDFEGALDLIEMASHHLLRRLDNIL